MARSLTMLSLAALFTLLVPVIANAALITVDGDLSDWGTGAGWGSWNDGNEPTVTDNYDIHYLNWHFGNKAGDPSGTTLFLSAEFYKAFAASGAGERGTNDFFNIQFNTVPGGASPTGMGGFWDESDFFFKWSMPDTPLLGPAFTSDLNWMKWNGASWAWVAGGAKEPGDSGVWAAWQNFAGTDKWYAEFAIPVTRLWSDGVPQDFSFSAYYDNGLPSADDYAPGEETYVPVDVPEPGTMGLFGLGMLGLLALRRRRAA